MKEINCYAKTCVFNDNTACKKDMIDVEKDKKEAARRPLLFCTDLTNISIYSICNL